MESFYLITPIALILIAVAIKLFIWAVNNGQFDDLDREASRILFDDDTKAAQEKSRKTDTLGEKTQDAHSNTQDSP